jgi:hypothetical protein
MGEPKTRLQQLKEKQDRLKLQIKMESQKEAKQVRNNRNTCIFTIGGALLAALNSDDPEIKNKAHQFWDDVIFYNPPGNLNDTRRDLLLNIHELKFKDAGG